jgi:UDP-glucose:(heptosyl)LPS alpha-1,3-glucosyltransferase
MVEHFDPHRGGAEHSAYQHAEQLIARGHEVHVVAQDFAQATAGLPIVRHCLGPIRSKSRQAEAAEQAVRGLPVEVVHDMGGGWSGDVLQSPDGSRIAQWEQMLKTLPPWARPCKRAMQQLLPRYRDFQRLMVRQFGDPSRIVLAISRMCAQDYERYHHVPPERIRVVYHGVDYERFAPRHCQPLRGPVRQRLGVAEDEVLFLFVGHAYRRKGLPTLLRAVERLAAEGSRVRLLVVGGDRHNRVFHISRRQRELTITAGSVDDPLSFYAAADALVLPSYYDPFGLVVLEAAACAMPVVVTRSTGASELLSDGVEGYILDDPADDAALAARLRQLLEPELRQQLGAAARRLALEHSLDRSCEETIDIYREIVARKQHLPSPAGRGQGEGDPRSPLAGKGLRVRGDAN